MADSSVNFVLDKLANVVVQDVLPLYGVNAQFETASHELSRIQAVLWEADERKITDERKKNWVNEMRDVAYSIEDAIDTFLIEVLSKPQKLSCMMQAMKFITKKTKKFRAVDKLVVEIRQIQERMTEIQEVRSRIAIYDLGNSSGEITRLPIRSLFLPDIDPDVVGFKEEQDHVIHELLNETVKRRSVVSIWGIGGLGKTTLAQKVYNSNDIKRQFELRIWIVISQKFELIELLIMLVKQLKLPIDLSKEPEEAVLTKLHEFLRGKKYLVVLDDVWTNDLWTQIKEAFPNENNGSRVLITTRFFDVAMDADPTCEPYKLEFLTKELSVELLLKKALPNQDPNKSGFDDLLDITNKFIHRCDGLPLALVVLGNLLSKKPLNNIAWSKVLQTMSWHVDGKQCSEIIGTSYEDLPFVLKSCFMYFAAFPEDYVINSKSLLRMWVAEGFIPEEDNKTLEETAESFLKDLVQRSMVQVTSRSIDGSIEYCRIHNLLQDLAVQKAKERNFLMVYSHPDDQKNLSRARRVAVHYPDCNELVMSQNLRTLLYFGNKSMPNCSKQKLLKVVSCVDSTDTEIKLGMFEGLTHLRYLNLIGKQIDDCEEGFLEKVIGTMNFLQTLDICIQCPRELVMVLPDCAWQIKTLRHVNSPISRLPPSAKLTNLQTLALAIIKEPWITELPHLPNLLALELKHESSSWGVVIAFLGTLKNLISLKIYNFSISLDIFDMRDFPFYQRLKFLYLCNRSGPNTPNEMDIDVVMFPPRLTSLTIISYRFQQDVMLVLEKLHYLKKLELDEACISRKISCSAKGFRQLEVLQLKQFNLLDWEIEEGAMSILRELTIDICPQLCPPQGLRHLTNLKKLTWCCGGKANEVRNLCKHVPSLRFDYL